MNSWAIVRTVPALRSGLLKKLVQKISPPEADGSNHSPGIYSRADSENRIENPVALRVGIANPDQPGDAETERQREGMVVAACRRGYPAGVAGGCDRRKHPHRLQRPGTPEAAITDSPAGCFEKTIFIP